MGHAIPTVGSPSIHLSRWAAPGSSFLSAELNLNYAYRDPIFHRAWGPAPLHLAVIFIPLVALIYWPTHVLLGWLFRAPGTSQ